MIEYNIQTKSVPIRFLNIKNNSYLTILIEVSAIGQKNIILFLKPFQKKRIKIPKDYPDEVEIKKLGDSEQELN
ncbi:hypothetical protein D920_00394 [Enterococcus faecalis 13-SD-W-01]|nr:hypothetical protein D920_00394 [Enterococcus faecalis 13-SD-W-01]